MLDQSVAAQLRQPRNSFGQLYDDQGCENAEQEHNGAIED